MKREFKVGDRVAAYIGRQRIVGTIETIYEGKHMVLNGSADLLHPKQCRHLVKKERRRVWIEARLLDRDSDEWDSDDHQVIDVFKEYHEDPDRPLVEFVEVRRK